MSEKITILIFQFVHLGLQIKTTIIFLFRMSQSTGIVEKVLVHFSNLKIYINFVEGCGNERYCTQHSIYLLDPEKMSENTGVTSINENFKK